MREIFKSQIQKLLLSSALAGGCRGTGEARPELTGEADLGLLPASKTMVASEAGCIDRE